MGLMTDKNNPCFKIICIDRSNLVVFL